VKGIIRYVGCLAGLLVLQGCSSDKKDEISTGLSMARDYSVGVSGYVALSDKTVNDLHVNGAAELNAVVVVNDAVINGNCDGAGVMIKGQLRVNGAVTLRDTTVVGTTTVNGVLTADQSTLYDMVIGSELLVLHNSSVGSITLTSAEGKESVIELDNTAVEGDITFVRGKGSVIVKNGTTIKGKVIGGVTQAE